MISSILKDFLAWHVMLLLLLLSVYFKEKGSTKGSRPVQGASLTHTQITITLYKYNTKQNRYNIHTRTITKEIHRN